MLTSDKFMRQMLDFIPPSSNAKEKEACLKERQKQFSFKPKAETTCGTRVLPCSGGRACTRGRETLSYPLAFQEQARNEQVRAGPDNGTAWWIGEVPL